MHPLFTLARIYPYWAVPLAVIFAELGIFYRRRRSKAYYGFFCSAGFLAFGILIWLTFRGDLNSDDWVRSSMR